MNISFLLGAGVSIPAGLPTTAELTADVLSVDKYTLHTDGHFYEAQLPAFGHSDSAYACEHLARVLKFVEKSCDDYFVSVKVGRTVNYEDLYYALLQVYEHLVEEYEDPALEPFVEALSRAMPSRLERGQLEASARIATGYIKDVVRLKLYRPARTLGHLSGLVPNFETRV